MNNIENFELFTSEDKDAIKFIKMKNSFDDATRAREMIDKQSKAMLSDAEATDLIDKRLSELSEDDIKKLSKEEINNIFNIDEEIIDLDNIHMNDDTEIKRDFLIFRKKAIDAFAYIDEETKKLNEELSNSKEDFERISSEFDTMTDVIVDRLNKRLEETDNEDEKNRIKQILIEVDNGFTLNNVKKYLSNELKRRSIYSNYGIANKTNKMYARYERALKFFGINENIKKYGNIEKAYLPEEYNNHPNMFAIIIMTFISDIKLDKVDKSQGVFISQFMANLKDLCYGKMKNDKKEEFINNIKEVLSMVEK